MPDFIWSASIKSAIRHHLDLAGKAEKRLSASSKPDSGYCRELKALSELHRRAAEIFKTAAKP